MRADNCRNWSLNTKPGPVLKLKKKWKKKMNKKKTKLKALNNKSLNLNHIDVQ